MEHHNVPQTLQTRVKRWAHYAWSRCVISAAHCARETHPSLILKLSVIATFQYDL